MQGQTASGLCLGVSREGSPLFGPSRIGCQGVQGEWRTTTLRAGMKGAGETSLSRAESPLRVWESWASPKGAAGGQGPGACPWRMRSSHVEPKGRSASYLVSKRSAELHHSQRDREREGQNFCLKLGPPKIAQARIIPEVSSANRSGFC